MANVSDARSKSPADLKHFRHLVMTGQALDHKGMREKARPYFDAAVAMINTKRIYFVEA